MDEKAIDLSPLDPSRDARRWEALTASVVERALAARAAVARQQRASPRLSVASGVEGQMLSWARPALALAAGLALLVWGMTFVLGAGASGTDAAERGVQSEDDTARLSGWAARDASPSSLEILATLGGDHDS